MEYQEHYDNMVERNNLCDVATSNNFRMLHDDFDEDWQRGDEPHGTLTFTDEPAPQNPPDETRDFGAEIDEMKAKMIVSEPTGEEVKIVNLTYNPVTKEVKHKEAP